MPKGRQPELPFPKQFAKSIKDIPVAKEMSESFLAYSLSVITSRAIPDVRDGLKPVQRRILYAMFNLGIRPSSPHRKCARVVGETMGSYHPHGDAAIYDALVRLGQDFARNITLIDPQGNFGSLDEAPAAPRYTECRLSNAAMAMLGELDEETVDFRGTYDGESSEPEYLCGLMPNLLVNGTSGIAVGMTTNMAPHNLAEVAKAIELVATKRRPKPTTQELMQHLPGPDFPSGGVLIDSGIKEIYETGKGTLALRAKAHIEQLTQKRQGIIITELPYMVGPERVVQRIKTLLANDRLSGVSAITDYSDRKHGLRLQIDCAIGVNPHQVLAQLYKLTPLEETVSINNVALVNGVPSTLGLYELCEHYINHRIDVITRRTQYRLGKAEDRLHIVTGLLIALDFIDEVIKIIRASKTVSEAKKRLCERFGLSEIQATHILDMQFRRLVALEREKLQAERDELQEKIASYLAILKSDTRKRTLMLKELDAFVQTHAKKRRTRIITEDELEVIPTEEATTEAKVEQGPAFVTLSSSGNIGQIDPNALKTQKASRHDLVVSSFTATTTDEVWAITDKARAISLPIHELSSAAARARGASATKVFGCSRGEKVIACFGTGIDETQSQTDDPEASSIMLVTKAGTAKRLNYQELYAMKSTQTVIRLKDGDRLVAAFDAKNSNDIAMISSDGQALRVNAAVISEQGHAAGGVLGMKLRDSATVVYAAELDEEVWDGIIATIATDGEAKATPFEELPTKGRGGIGVRIHKLRTKAQRVSVVHIGAHEETWVFKGLDDDPTKLDPTPVKFELEPTRRELTPTKTERPILAIGRYRFNI